MYFSHSKKINETKKITWNLKVDNDVVTEFLQFCAWAHFTRNYFFPETAIN